MAERERDDVINAGFMNVSNTCEKCVWGHYLVKPSDLRCVEWGGFKPKSVYFEGKECKYFVPKKNNK